MSEFPRELIQEQPRVVFEEDPFAGFEIEHSRLNESVLKLKQRFKKIYDSFVFYKDLYQIYGHDGVNKDLSDYAITNYNVFEKLLILYRQNIASAINVYGKDLNIEKLQGVFEDLQSEVFFVKKYLEISSKLYKDDGIDNMPDIVFDVVSSQDLSKNKKMQESMMGMYSKHYSSYPEFSKKICAALEDSFFDGNSQFVILTLNQRLIGFYRLNDVDKNTVRFSAFNLTDDYRGLGFGESMMSKYLDVLVKEKVVIAECDPLSRIGSNYIERGFYAVGYGYIGEKPKLDIENSSSRRFKAKQMSEDEIVTSKGEDDMFIETHDSQSDFDFDKINKGFILTRYFRYKNNKWYAVFEKAA